jgi:hypothetical protein
MLHLKNNAMRNIFFCLLLCLLAGTAGAQQLKISYTTGADKSAFSGKVFLYLSKDNRNPKDGEVGVSFFPCFATDVKNIQAGTVITIDDKALSYPVPLSDIERGTYFVQAVWDRNLGGRSIAKSPGNMFSKPIQVMLTKDYKKSFTIVCSEIVPMPEFKETEFVKELKAPSALLSAFHIKPVTVDAAVTLPAEYYTQPSGKFPVVFYVFGYGGNYHFFSGDTSLRSSPIDTIPCITVYLDGNCPLGHCVYANSDNNGPWGDALVKEFIPALESRFRCNGARLLRGHSSGGWTVLWLQTQYPSVFAGCWSSSPDPVDFRSFQKVNLYNGDNMFYDKDSVLRSVATVAGFFPWATQKQAYQAENVIYRGEQMHSFDAVFGGKGPDGNPERICDAATGAINTKAFEHWKHYDISLNLRNNWNILKQDLEGKIRVTVGDQDNFLLNDAVHLLDEEMKKLDTKFVFAYYSGDHFTVSTAGYKKDGLAFLESRYAAWQKQHTQ